jgi:hypothetical protein
VVLPRSQLALYSGFPLSRCLCERRMNAGKVVGGMTKERITGSRRALLRRLALAAAGVALAGSSVARWALDARAEVRQAGGGLGSRRLFSADNPWNADISAEPVDPLSDTLLASIGLDRGLHPDFGTTYDGAPNGLPYVVVGGDQPKVPVRFEYDDESDPGPYPVPPDAPIEGGPDGDGDRHVLVVDRDRWLLYELYDARPLDGGSHWTAGSGAIFDLNANTLRPAGWTSADAAGLPILPGLVRYDEAVEAGAILHALRFTVQRTRRAYVAPARHFASERTDPGLPPMGMRVRLRAGFDTSSLPPVAQVILTALKRYGMFVADNGSDWFISGAPDPRWSDDDLGTLRRVHGRDFEVVQMGDIVTS